MRLTIRRLALLAGVLGSLLAPASASATATAEQIKKSLTSGVIYLKGLQKESGEIAGFGGDWALTAFAAAKVAAADVNKAGQEGTEARRWEEGVGGAPARGRAGAVAA